jgi:hypothetical protein
MVCRISRWGIVPARPSSQILDELTGLLELKEDETPKASLERLFRKHPG